MKMKYRQVNLQSRSDMKAKQILGVFLICAIITLLQIAATWAAGLLVITAFSMALVKIMFTMWLASTVGFLAILYLFDR